jgi:hypothetical protein
MPKPDYLTTFDRSHDINYIYLNIIFLTPAFNGQIIPANKDQTHWLYQYTLIYWTFLVQIKIDFGLNKV